MSNEKLDQNTLISILGEVHEEKPFIETRLDEKENFKNAMGNIFQQNPSIQPKIVTPDPAKNSANNNPSILSSAKMGNATSILGETTGSKSFMAMTATEKEIFKNAMGNIFLKNLPIHQTTVIPVPITKESSETKPSDQGEHRRKFVDVLNQIKLNNPVAQERTAESAKKEFTENTSLILPSEEKSGQEGKTGSLNQLTSQTKKTGGVPLSKSTYVNNIRDLQNNPIYQRIARQLSNEVGNNGKFNNGEVENGKVDNGRLSNGQKKELRVILGDCGTQVVKIDSQSERPTASPNLVSRVNNPKGAVGYDR